MCAICVLFPLRCMRKTLKSVICGVLSCCNYVFEIVRLTHASANFQWVTSGCVRLQLLGLNSDIGELLLSEVNNGGLKALFAKILEAVCR
jgi:hypothetical protein